MTLLKSTATIGGYTLLSRVLGFVRDVTIASSLGASMLSDAFFVAFKLPNFLRRLFAEGAFNAAFVPQYAGMQAVEGDARAKAFAGDAMSFLLMVLVMVAGVFIVIMPWLMFVLAPGFSDDPEKFNLTVTLTRITMPYIIFISLVSLLGGVLNSHDKFAAVAATPVIMNLCLIIIPFLIDGWTPTGAHALAIAVLISGVAQWLWLIEVCRKRGVLPRFVRPRLSPDVKKMLWLIAPAAMGAGVAQINLFIDIIIASQFDSGVSYLYYADRINELPLAVIGIAIGTSLLPMLSRQIREGKTEAAYHSQNRAIELAMFFSIPACVAMMLIAEPIIRTMYERAAFNAHDTHATYRALIAFAAGLPAFVLAKILAPNFYAHEDTKTPFKIGAACIVVNLVFNLLLMQPLQHVGMAVATSIAGWVNAFALLYVLHKRRWVKIDRSLLLQIFYMCASAALMGGALIALTSTGQIFAYAGEFWRFASLIALSMLGAAAYFAGAIACNCLNMRERIFAKKGA